jgi:hypothetical protein
VPSIQLRARLLPQRASHPLSESVSEEDRDSKELVTAAEMVAALALVTALVVAATAAGTVGRVPVMLPPP